MNRNDCPDTPGDADRSSDNATTQVRFPWRRKDMYGWPIERIKGRPFLNFVRLVLQNIRKLTE